jgi:hypothetical protein
VKHFKRRVLVSVLSLVMGVGFSFSALKVFSTTETRSWFLEGTKPNQASFLGRYPDTWFGGALAVGDVNGDGFDDLITNARYVQTDVQAGGEVYVVPGPLSFNEVYTMPQRAAIVFQGTSEYQPQIGIFLDSGDMNGDGIDDIVMGSWISEKVYVYLGSPDIQSSTPVTIPATSDNMALTISPMDSGLIFCDFNADGFQDLFVEKLLSSDGLGLQVWGVLGTSTMTITNPATRMLPAEADIIINEFHVDHWGTPGQLNLACGDIDGDGAPDLAVGVYAESPSYRHGAGVVYVLRGNPEITAGSPVTLTMPDQADAIIEGVDGRLSTDGDSFGASMVSADVNIDGRADLILGAPGASGPDNLIQRAGEVYLWLGRDLVGQRFIIASQASWTVYGEKRSESLGSAIVAGDFDRDGYPEILLGCPNCAPEGPPAYNSGRGYVLEPLQIEGQAAVTAVSRLNIVRDESAKCLGSAVAAMDLNGDHVKDLVLSAPCTDFSESDLPGIMYVVSYPDHFRSFLPFVR